jgi:ribonuclease G
MSECCRSCNGHGRKRTKESVALEIIRSIEQAAAAAPGKPIAVRASAEVVRWLDDHGEEIRAALTRRGATRVAFEANDAFAREGFDVTTL